MSVEAFIADAGTQCAIEADQTANAPAQTAMGGVDRSADNWIVIQDAVPCLIDILSQKREMINNQLQYVSVARIYLIEDPVPEGLSIKHRIRVTIAGKPGRQVEGVWAIEGVQDPVPYGHHLEVQCVRVGLP